MFPASRRSIFGSGSAVAEPAAPVVNEHAPGSVRLPAPWRQGERGLEESIARRRSVRRFAAEPLPLADLGQLLWAAQGVTDDEGRRAAPSAGALYPLDVLVVAGAVRGLAPGIYRYRPEGHRLEPVVAGDARRPRLAEALPWQEWAADAPVVVAFVGVPSRAAGKYGPRAERYLLLEAGAAAENLHLQATALKLASVLVGSFDDRLVSSILGLCTGEEPLALMPVGTPRYRIYRASRPVKEHP